MLPLRPCMHCAALSAAIQSRSNAYGRTALLSAHSVSCPALQLIPYPCLPATLQPTGERLFTPQQLQQFDGTRGRRIYLAILGSVYDVTPGAKHYGKHLTYMLMLPFHLACSLSCLVRPFACLCKHFQLQALQRNASPLHLSHYVGKALHPSAGPKGGYRIFAGRDASRSYVTGK